MKNNLPKLKIKKGKRVGRGYGSGKGGHTIGRGQKGQKTRRKIGILFEGMKMKKSLIKRLPLKRGRLKFTAGVKPVAITLKTLLKVFGKGAEVTEKSLIEKGLITLKELRKRGVKVIGLSKLKNTGGLKINVATSRVEKVTGDVKAKMLKVKVSAKTK